MKQKVLNDVPHPDLLLLFNNKLLLLFIEGGGVRSMNSEMCSKLSGFPEGTYLAVHPLSGGGTSASERCLLVEGDGLQGQRSACERM